MATEGTSRPSRSRWLAVALGVAIVALLMTRMWSDGSPRGSAGPSAPSRGGRTNAEAPIDPEELQVRLESLEAARPGQGDMARNPFRFQPKAPPPPPPGPPPSSYVPAPVAPVGPPPPAPIPLKLMGFVDLPGGRKIAALSDCKGATFSAGEADVVDGQYRIVKIGIESVDIEYVNGKGRQTLRVEGCPPR